MIAEGFSCSLPEGNGLKTKISGTLTPDTIEYMVVTDVSEERLSFDNMAIQLFPIIRSSVAEEIVLISGYEKCVAVEMLGGQNA